MQRRKKKEKIQRQRDIKKNDKKIAKKRAQTIKKLRDENKRINKNSEIEGSE